jgi:hypothetical protein
MRKRLQFIFIILILNACFPLPATDEQKNQVMNTLFDKSIIADTGRYEKLKSFLFIYGDTILLFRDSKNYALEVGADNKTDTVLQTQNCYNFFQGNPNYDYTNVPDFLKLKLDSICQEIGVSNMESFEICKGKKISIKVRSEGGENGLHISHILLWNNDNEKSYTYTGFKDTLLSNNCVYRIEITEHHGH